MFLKNLTVALGATLLTVSCATKAPVDTQLNQMLAQKLMLDLRYYCPQLQQGETCTKAMTELPAELSDMLANSGIGGVVLFANNLENTEQMLRLNYALQAAAKRGGHAPLFIAIDQEGGRVVRIPQNLATSFAGNMAIGATYAKHGDKFATQSGEIIAKELLSLGFNVNFAPTVDVNVNPQNPVINVRSYGEDAQIVAQLGTAQMAAMQAQGMIATLKHFPGHGDTNVDSHTGLPRVEHELAQIEASDLLPFAYAIEHDKPGMIMTAHIQYPQLDNSEFIAKDGSKVILPATMSRKILTDLLRKRMAYQGVIVTDALDMAGIAHYFEQNEAVIQTFAAGADIALMPLAIRSPADIAALRGLLDELAAAVRDGRLQRSEIAASAGRIAALKQQYQLSQATAVPLAQAISQAEQILANPVHRAVEQQLANQAIVALKNQQAWPLNGANKHLQLLMPDNTKCMAMTLALKTRLPELMITCSSMATGKEDGEVGLLPDADVVIAADISPDQSLVELGGMDDIASWRERLPKEQQIAHQLALLQAAKAQGKTTIFISLRTPYNAQLFAPYADGILASFAYNLNKNQYVDDYGRMVTEYEGAIYQALADVLSGHLEASGSLPVSVALPGQ